MFFRFFKKVLLGLGILFLVFLVYFFTPLEIPFLTGLIGTAPQAAKITWGVNFSQKQTELLGLDWQETYLALLDDLKVKNIKLITHWDLIEPEQGKYNFDDLDWQIKEAENHNAKILLVIGMKTGRWPECHEPDWVRNQKSKIESQKLLLEYIEKVVNRYKDNQSIWAWQVENEPFFSFGECPWTDKDFLKKEINLVKSLDNRPVLISDTGEFSFWFNAAKLGDTVGITLHRRVWSEQLKIYVFHQWFKPIYYWRKAEIIKKIFNKKVIGVELQAEPWGPELIPYISLEEQKKTMNLERFRENIEFAKKTGLDTFYFWGGEWWYWLKEKQGKPEIWQEAKKLFNQ